MVKAYHLKSMATPRVVCWSGLKFYPVVVEIQALGMHELEVEQCERVDELIYLVFACLAVG